MRIAVDGDGGFGHGGATTGLEAILVPSAEVEPLAQAMETAGERRAAASARWERQRGFGPSSIDWTRYHDAIVSVFANG